MCFLIRGEVKCRFPFTFFARNRLAVWGNLYAEVHSQFLLSNLESRTTK